MYSWVAPCQNTEEVQAVYVNRIVLVRQPAADLAVIEKRRDLGQRAICPSHP